MLQKNLTCNLSHPENGRKFLSICNVVLWKESSCCNYSLKQETFCVCVCVFLCLLVCTTSVAAAVYVFGCGRLHVCARHPENGAGSPPSPCGFLQAAPQWATRGPGNHKGAMVKTSPKTFVLITFGYLWSGTKPRYQFWMTWTVLKVE